GPRNTRFQGPPHSSTAPSIDALSARSRWIDLTPDSFTLAKSITTTSAPASPARPAVAPPIPQAPPTRSTRLPSYRNLSNNLKVVSLFVLGPRTLRGDRRKVRR